LLNNTEIKQLYIIFGSSSTVESKHQNQTVTVDRQTSFFPWYCRLVQVAADVFYQEWKSSGSRDCAWHKTGRKRNEKGNKLHITDKYLHFVHIPAAMKHSLKYWRE